MWKKSAEIASSEIKMSKKQKSSLKRVYDKQEQMNSIISDKKPYYRYNFRDIYIALTSVDDKLLGLIIA